MKKYIGVKIIDAELGMAPAKMGSHEKGERGMRVVYKDGYESWSPQDVFDDAYRPIDGMTFGLAIEAMRKGYRVARRGWNGKGIFIGIQKGFDLEAAAAASHEAWMKQKRSQGVESRLTEDGCEQMVPYHELPESSKELARAGVSGEGQMTGDFIYIDTTGLITDNPAAPKKRVPWLASQTDMLAEDWMIVE